MTSILLELVGAKATAVTTGTLTEGMVGVTVHISCDSEWDGLIKTLVCESEAGKRVILNVGDTVVIPPELLRCWAYGPGRLMLGLEGRKPDGTVVIPSTWADAGMIMPGTDLNGDPTIAQENASWANLLQMIGSLDELKTTDRENLVAAINETLEKARGGTNGVAPRNLLDNSDFRDPVNQRGQSAYTQDSGYTIDRWRMQWSGDGTLAVNDGYISLSRSQNNTYLFQLLPNFTALSGKTLTIAARVRGNGALGYRINIADTQNQLVIRNVEDWTTVAAVVQMPAFTAGDLTDPVYGFSMYCEPGKQLDVQWAALYEGAYTAQTLPEYQPKGYAHELMECMRYYQRYTGTCHYNGDVNGPATKIYFAVPVPIKPRITPSLKVSGDVFVKGTGGGGNYSLDEHPLSVASAANVGNQVNLEMDNPSTTLFPKHSPAGLNIGSMVLEFSADL